MKMSSTIGLSVGLSNALVVTVSAMNFPTSRFGSNPVPLPPTGKAYDPDAFVRRADWRVGRRGVTDNEHLKYLPP